MRKFWLDNSSYLAFLDGGGLKAALQKPRKGTMKKLNGTRRKSEALQKTNNPEARADCKVTGTRSESSAEQIITQLAAVSLWHGDKSKDQRVLAAVDRIAEFEPANTLEALLSVQMFGVHEAALTFLQRATMAEQTLDGTDANVLRATRLMRLFNEQVELLSKLKGKTSQQRVVVEHVNVYPGAQAVVGMVGTKGGQREGGNEGTRESTL